MSWYACLHAPCRLRVRAEAGMAAWRMGGRQVGLSHAFALSVPACLVVREVDVLRHVPSFGSSFGFIRCRH